MSKRLKFACKHFLISALIGTLTALLIYYVWYPYPLNIAVGVDQIFLMFIGIDIIIGPILGFLVYKESKKNLKFDLFIVVLFQFSAFIFGLISLEKARPAWIVFNLNQFELILKNEIILPANKSNLKYKESSWFGPQWVSTTPAKNITQKNNDIFDAVFNHVSTAQKVERYTDIRHAKSTIINKSIAIKELSRFNEDVSILQTIPEATKYLPLKSKLVDMTVLLDENGNAIKIVNLRPW
ncbi:TfpX/TfpZ family type IV pilin accessory protein [Acinetobacter lanii]|uniref:Type IV pilin accessory protein n=1 Tax=Acinetobacter lanii TaxID=2715163 RepID=A0A6G8S7F8_9GAMM|nr:TfpX/TfpZ family type IV pilin accessory protein [Acinetobacter lanii]QIO09988.1 type IV pilin accessory protein [Acinetobacter lanii]